MGNNDKQPYSYDLMFSIACYIQSTAVFMSFITGVAKQATWLVIILGYILSLPVIWIYVSLCRKYCCRSLIKINELVFGKYIGKVISLLYIFYFFSLIALNLNSFSQFTVGALLPETPAVAILIGFIFACCYAVRKGPQRIAYYGTLFVIITIVILLFNAILLIKDMKFDNFFPLFNLPFSDYVQATQTLVFLPFTEIIVFFAFFPMIKQPSHIRKSLFGGLTIGAATLLMVAVRNIAVLGSSLSYFNSPAFEAVRLINVGKIFTRMEIFYAAILTMLMFFKVTVLLYATTKSIEELFQLNSYKSLVPSVSVISIIGSLVVFDSAFEHDQWGENVAAIYSVFFVFILPLLTLLITIVRGLYTDKGDDVQ